MTEEKGNSPRKKQMETKYMLKFDGQTLAFDNPFQQPMDGVPIGDTSGMECWKDGDKFKLEASYRSYTAFMKHLAGVK